MKKTRVTILNDKHNEKNLINILNILIGYASIDPETVHLKIKEFREGNEFHYDVLNENLETLLEMLAFEKIKFMTESLD